MKLTSEVYCQLRLLKLDDDKADTYVRSDTLRLILAALDAGHGDALRHFAAHGALPPVAPVWPGLETRLAEGYLADAWDIWRPGREKLVACVRPLRGEWECIAGTSRATTGPTPQAAVDAAREELRRWWAL